MALPARTPDELLTALSGRHSGSQPILAVLPGGLNQPGVTATRSDYLDELRMELVALGESTADAFDEVLSQARRAMVAIANGKPGVAASYLAWIEDQAPVHSMRARRAARVGRIEPVDGGVA